MEKTALKPILFLMKYFLDHSIDKFSTIGATSKAPLLLALFLD